MSAHNRTRFTHPGQTKMAPTRVKRLTQGHCQWQAPVRVTEPRGCSSMVEQQLPKLNTRVRFPSPAPKHLKALKNSINLSLRRRILVYVTHRCRTSTCLIGA
jgi:hypothetical protein